MTFNMLVVDDEEADVIRFKRAARKAGVQRRIEIRRGGAEAFGLLASKKDRKQRTLATCSFPTSRCRL